MCEKHQKFMHEAIQLSADNITKETGGPFGAVVVKDGKIVGRGANAVTTDNDPTAHAEVMAIRDACKNLNDFSLEGCVIYSSCEPCPMCLSAIYWARLDRVYYANTQDDAASIDFDDRFLYDELAMPMEKRQMKCEQMMRDEAFEVFETWRNKQDKIHY